MFRKIHWSIPLLAVLFIGVGGFVYWQWSSVQHLKDEIAQDQKQIQENDKPIVKDKQPTAKLVQHDDRLHEVPIDTDDNTIIVEEVPAYKPPVIPNYDGPLSDHAKLIETDPVQALRLQSQERGHWSTKWIPPFPPDDQEAAEIAKAVYVWVDYYKIKGNSDKDPRPTEILYAEQLIYNLNKRFYEESASTRIPDPRRNDLFKLIWARRDQSKQRPEMWSSTFDK